MLYLLIAIIILPFCLFNGICIRELYRIETDEEYYDTYYEIHDFD